MASMVLVGDTLGKKRQNYNTLVKQQANNEIDLSEINFQTDDVNNLFKIDIASKNRNLDYILKVLKCEDMLYVSRAIKQSTWLITDQEYSHIINPKYLQSDLFPEMTSKAKMKLLLHIRLHLKDELRAESFYNYYEEKDLACALKWLPLCSESFIEKIIKKHADAITIPTLKRLCERSFKFLKIYNLEYKYSKHKQLKIVMFLLKTHTDEYLDIIESQFDESGYRGVKCPNFGRKATQFMMTRCPDRVMDKFEYYARYVDIPTFAKLLKKKDIKDFLIKFTQRLKEKLPHLGILRCYLTDIIPKLLQELLTPLLNKPDQNVFDFVKAFFIDKTYKEEQLKSLDPDLMVMFKIYSEDILNHLNIREFHWYLVAPFDVAFIELKKLIASESAQHEKYSKLEVLLKCTRYSTEQLSIVLQYYIDKHITDQIEFKKDFVDKIISNIHIQKCDDKIWQLLDNIFVSMDIYVESEEYNKTVVETIIVYSVINNKVIPEVIEKKFVFDSLKSYRSKLDDQKKEMIFRYLYNEVLKKVDKLEIANEGDFIQAIRTLDTVLNLLKDWDKDLINYPLVINKIKYLIKVKRENLWNHSLSVLYNSRKTWRKYLFEESILLSPTDDVCVNVLKHDPSLFTRYKAEIEVMFVDDSISLKRLLSKVRVYWPDTLAKDWNGSHQKRLTELGGHKALTRGLCALLPQQELLDIITKYTPKESKINWNEIDEVSLSIQRQLAKNMHFSRPQPPPDAIINFSKGDYLQYSLPSLYAIFYNISSVKSREHLPKLWNAPVSLQKHGIRFAFMKLNSDELKNVFADIWKSSKNVTLRAVIFKLTFNLLCKEKNSSKIEGIWELLEIFIDNLTMQENKLIYELMTKIRDVPLDIRAKYLKKCYTFLKILLPSLNSDVRQDLEYKVNSLMWYSREIMEFMDLEFVAEIILKYIELEYVKIKDKNKFENMLSVISAYVLNADNEDTQMKRYHQVIAPLLKETLAAWDDMEKGEFYVRHTFDSFLSLLHEDLRYYVIKKNKIIPLKMFQCIQNEIQKLPISKNYIMLTRWKLSVALAKVLNDHTSIAAAEQTETTEEGDEIEQEICDEDKTWHDVSLKIAPKYGEICLQYLKEDVNLHFPNIYVLFVRALKFMIRLVREEVMFKIYKKMLEDQDFVYGYLAVIKLMPMYYGNDESQVKCKELHALVLSHPKVEVKMHYYCGFPNIGEEY